MNRYTMPGMWLRLACAGTLTLLLVLPTGLQASAEERPINGMTSVEPRWDALVGATLVPWPGERIENATVVLRDGLIVSFGAGATPPDGARLWDVEGMTVYAGFVDPHVGVETPLPDSNSAGVHWNSKVTPQRRALDGTGISSGVAKELREQGFTAAAISPSDGVFRGFGSVVSLGQEHELLPASRGGFNPFGGDNSDREKKSVEPFAGTVYANDVYLEVAMEEAGFRGRGAYPTSNMGAIAVIRQLLAESDWYAQQEDVEYSAALEAIGPGGEGSTRLLFNADDTDLELLWAATILEEYGRDVVLMGQGTEYRHLEAISSLGMPIIIPVEYPEMPSIGSMAEAESYSLFDLMSWEQAPTNARRLVQSGMTVALTTDKLESRSDFWDNVRQAIKQGLSEDDALAMITTTPAELLGVEEMLGRVEPGFAANLVVVEGSIFDKDSKIQGVWIDGIYNEIEADEPETYEGVWDGQLGDASWEYRIKGDSKVTLVFQEQEQEAQGVTRTENRLSFTMNAEKFGTDGYWLTTLVFDDKGETYTGVSLTPSGEEVSIAGRRVGDLPEEDKDQEGAADENGEKGADAPKADKDQADEDEETASDVPEELPVPFGAYGFFEQPEQEDVAIVHGTIWTSGGAGIIQDGAMIVENGKITWVGAFDEMPTEGRTLRIIDATGQHVSPGIIDAHSHTGIGAGFGDVNEVGQPVTAEARVFDIINPDDINWYRELAGGLTMANQLHGSANVIGGQNSVIKNRWGSSRPSDFRMQGAHAGIKFALGENPKRDSWKYLGEARYPQTRMGVGALIIERFEAASDYTRAKASGEDPRPDMELEALAEILVGDRLIHCHSYRQDEIFMLTKIAQQYGFKIGTFQHVLEGYKVAEAIKETALGASTFSDWWAYKFEVFDAIPYNGAIMHEVGVPVSFNSDSNELARRLNTEATKAVRYGGVDEPGALQFVTLNPAIQLDIADRVGSLEVGKDADFVIWTASPLSALARADQTWIDGTLRYSIERDAESRAWVTSERQRLLQKVFKQGGKADKDKDKGKDKKGHRGMGRGRPTQQDVRMEMIERFMLENQFDGLNGGLQDCSECGVFDMSMGGAR